MKARKLSPKIFSGDRCLVEIAQAIGRWHRLRSSVQFLLIPEELSREIGPLLRNHDLRCIYRVLGKNDTEEGPEKVATIRRLPGRQVIIRTDAVPDDVSIMVEVWIGRTQLLWNPQWQPVNSRTIQLEKVS